MNKILILGANGQIARVATELFLEINNVELKLFLRKSSRINNLKGKENIQIIEGDVLDEKALENAMVGCDVVYANLSGNMEQQAQNIVKAMSNTGVKRLIFVSSMGIYDEVPGERHGSILDPYRNSVKVIEASNLDYTIIRPAWLNNNNEIAYGTTKKGETFKNHSAYVLRKSVADLIVRLSTTPNFEIRSSLGVHKA
jgi:uncharacterized protein YbjT (DUF2867 family)